MGSTRLPGKILKPFFEEKELLLVLLENLHKVPGAKVIVATSLNPENDALVDFLQSHNELVFRGSENDVLERFILAAEYFHVDSVVRICSDNPFMDVSGIMSLVEKAKETQPDYVGFRINGKPSILTHFGFWGEFVNVSALKRVFELTPVSSPAHEHVTIDIYNHPDEFDCQWIDCPAYLVGREDIRLTIDTQEDFEIVQRIYSDLKQTVGEFTLADVVEYIDAHTDLRDSMAHIIQSTKKAGYDYKR